MLMPMPMPMPMPECAWSSCLPGYIARSSIISQRWNVESRWIGAAFARVEMAMPSNGAGSSKNAIAL
jgi:hypothetical protein